MQISLRSQMMAGAFAVVGASAIAITPVAQQSVALQQLPSLRTAAVELNAFVNPYSALISGLSLVNNDLFNPFQTYPGPTGPIPQGLIPQLLDNPTPISAQIGNNVAYYTGNAISNLFTNPSSTANILTTTLFNIPSTTLDAFAEVLGGDFAGAIEVLYEGLIAPIPFAIDAAINAIATPITNTIEHGINLLLSVPTIVGGFVQTTVDALALLSGVAIGVAADVFAQAISFDIEGAWNTYWVGAFSESGFAGQLERLTLGPGISTTDGFLNSFRGWATAAQQTIVNALSTVNSLDEAPSAAAVAPAAAKVAAAAAVDSDTKVEAPAGLAAANDAAADDSAAVTTAAGDDSTAGGATAGDNDSDSAASAASDDTKAAAKASGKGHAKSHGSARSAASN